MLIFESAHPLSIINSVDPRPRIVFVFVFALTICLSSSLPVLLLALGMAGTLVAFSSIKIKQVFRRLGELNLLMLLLFITLPFCIPGDPLLKIGNFSFTNNGLQQALFIALRANTVMITATALIGTIEPPHLGFALNSLRIPDKLVHTMLFMIRYIEVIHVEYHRLRDALRLRGFRPRCNFHTFKTFGYVIGLLVLRSLDRAERIIEAMKCRGFRGRFYVLSPFRISAGDICFMAVGTGCVALLVWMELQ